MKKNKKKKNGIQRYAAIYSDGPVIRRSVYSTVTGRLGYMLGILNNEKKNEKSMFVTVANCINVLEDEYINVFCRGIQN